MSLGYLYDIADALLEDARVGLSQPRTGRADPEQAYVAHGPPAAPMGESDSPCNTQLTVHIDPTIGVQVVPFSDSALPRSKGSACVKVPMARFCITWFRCVPTLRDDGRPQDAGVYDKSARELYEDLWSLLTYLLRLWKNGDLAGGNDCSGIEFQNAIPVEPSGGIAGWLLPIDIQLSDSGPAYMPGDDE